MATIADRIKGVLANPRAKGMMDRGRQQMAKPGPQQRLRQVADRVRGMTGPRR